ncbi:MAG: ribonuclease H-like YkuK family protein [Minisyncoccales bacterium]
MNKFLKGKFYNPTKGKIELRDVMNEIKTYMERKPDKFYEITVGCDSPAQEDPFFPLAIVVRRKGQGGRFFLKKVEYKQNDKFKNWRMRILEEVILSCELGNYLRENFEIKLKKSKTKFNYRLEYIHADVGKNGITKDMIKEVVGLIKGNGFKPKIKPDAFAATSVADRYT